MGWPCLGPVRCLHAEPQCALPPPVDRAVKALGATLGRCWLFQVQGWQGAPWDCSLERVSGRSQSPLAAFSEPRLGQQPPGLPSLPHLPSSPCPFCAETCPVRVRTHPGHAGRQEAGFGGSSLWESRPPPLSFTWCPRTGPGPFPPTQHPSPLPGPQRAPQPTFPSLPLPPNSFPLRRSPVHPRAPSPGDSGRSHKA